MWRKSQLPECARSSWFRSQVPEKFFRHGSEPRCHVWLVVGIGGDDAPPRGGWGCPWRIMRVTRIRPYKGARMMARKWGRPSEVTRVRSQEQVNVKKETQERYICATKGWSDNEIKLIWEKKIERWPMIAWLPIIVQWLSINRLWDWSTNLIFC